MSAPTGVPERARRPGIRFAAAALAAVVAFALALWLALPYITLSPDARYSLAWGALLAEGEVPDFASPSVSTSHPLPVAVGVLLSPLGPGAAADAYAVLSLAAFGLLLYAAFRLGRALGGLWAGTFAAALVAVQPRLDFFAAHAFIDIPFAALVVLAAALAAGRPRARSLPALALLSVAGLLRPEVWGLALLYACWLAWGARAEDRARKPVAGALALGLSAPVVWMLFDLVLTGDPLLSLTGTQERTEALARPTGIDSLLPELDLAVRTMVGWPLAACGVALAAWALVGKPRPWEGSPDRPAFAAATAVVLAGAGAYVALAVLDLPLNDRYIMTAAVALVALAAASLGWARHSWVAAVLLAATLVAAALPLPDDLRDTDRMLELSKRKHDADEDLGRLLDRASVRNHLRRCRNLVVSGSARAAVAAELERDPAKLPRARSPVPESGQAAISTSDTVQSSTPGATREGAWTFVNRC